MRNGRPVSNLKKSANGNSSKTLIECCPGEDVTVQSIHRDVSCGQRLRELGLVEGTSLQLLKQSDPLLLLAHNSRIAIDPRIARSIKVICNCNGSTVGQSVDHEPANGSNED